MPLNKNYSRVLKELARAGREIKWLVRGSTCLALYGIKIIPHDIDINTTAKGIRVFEKALKKYIIVPPRFSEFKWLGRQFRSEFCKFSIKGIEIEVVANWQEKIGKTWTRHKLQKPVFLSLNGLDIPVNTIQDELAHAIKRRRKERVELIHRFLKNEI